MLLGRTTAFPAWAFSNAQRIEKTGKLPTDWLKAQFPEFDI